MSETFYSALEVDADADGGEIREAYRRKIKESHPDVSDDPGTAREFRRLTTARDVLTDAAERDRYDSLGHETYVTRHVETSAWAGGTGERSGSSGRPSGEATATEGVGRHRRSEPGDGDRSAWLGEDWEGPRARSRDPHRGANGDSPGASSETGEASWQQASAAYRYTPSTGSRRSRSRLASLRRVLPSVAPWLVVHLVLFVSAVAMAWYVAVGTARFGQYSVLSILVGVLLVGLVALLSVLHLVSVVYG